MHILKLKNCLIVAILWGISSSYCADGEIDDSFAPTAFSWSRRSMSGSEENCEEAEYQRLLKTFVEAEQRRKKASQRWRENISAGFQAFYSQEAAADVAQCLPRVDLHDGHTSDEESSGLITPASFIRHPDILPLGSVSDTAESTGILSPIALTHTHAFSAEDAEVCALATLHALTLPIRVASPSLSDNDGSGSSQPSSPGSSTHSQCDYVSDSDDEEPKQRGFFGAIIDTLFGW